MTTLRIVLRNYADFENALGEQARLFESAHPGIQVELDSVGIHELHQSAIAEGGLRDGRFDLALLVTDWLAEGIAFGALEDLHTWQHARAASPTGPTAGPHSLVRPLVFGGNLSSLPWHDGPECLVYRSDLFADTTRAAFASQFARELAPPPRGRNSKRLRASSLIRPTVVYGTVFAAFPDGHNTLYDFALQLWSRGGRTPRFIGPSSAQFAASHSGPRFLPPRHSRSRALPSPIAPARLDPVRRSLSRRRSRHDGQLVRICRARPVARARHLQVRSPSRPSLPHRAMRPSRSPSSGLLPWALAHATKIWPGNSCASSHRLSAT